MKLDYFYGNQAAQFSFIKIPKILVMSDQYEGLGTDSMLLYALLLDRMGEARSNDWFDELGRAYVVYPIKDIQHDLNISKKRAMQCLFELAGKDLIARKHRGNGLADIIYVKKIVA